MSNRTAEENRLLTILRRLYGQRRHYYSKNVNQLEKATEEERVTFLSLRITTAIILMVLLVYHIRSLRVFRWEQSVSGGVLVTYVIAVIGLILCTGTSGSRALQAYLLSTGSALLVANAAGLWRRWSQANEFTRAVAELLFALGVPLRRQVMVKVWLSAVAALLLLIDLCLLPILGYIRYTREDPLAFV